MKNSSLFGVIVGDEFVPATGMLHEIREVEGKFKIFVRKLIKGVGFVYGYAGEFTGEGIYVVEKKA